MNITVNLSPSEEAFLSAQAMQDGLEPAELIEKWVRQRISSTPSPLEQLDEKLRKWQAETDTTLYHNDSLHELFEQWAKEDEQKTPEEIAEANQLWRDVQQGIDEQRKLAGMRTLFDG